MVPPKYWPVFIPHRKRISQILWLVEETIICFYMPTEHFAHNPMELFVCVFFLNHVGMVSSISSEETE